MHHEDETLSYIYFLYETALLKLTLLTTRYAIAFQRSWVMTLIQLNSNNWEKMWKVITFPLKV